MGESKKTVIGGVEMTVDTENFLEIGEEVYVVVTNDDEEGAGKPEIRKRIIDGYQLDAAHGWVYLCGGEVLFPREAHACIDEAVAEAEREFVKAGWNEGSPLKNLLRERHNAGTVK